MQHKPVSSASETYKLKMATFENVKPEYFLRLPNNFKTDIGGTGTTAIVGKINYLQTMLHVESL